MKLEDMNSRLHDAEKRHGHLNRAGMIKIALHPYAVPVDLSRP
jgi:hypothetical protein